MIITVVALNLQIDTNEPGRIIGYHGKVLKALQSWLGLPKLSRVTAIQEPSTLLDYVEHCRSLADLYAKIGDFKI